MKSLRVLLRQTMAVALLSLPLESFAGDDRRIALTFGKGPQPGASGELLDELERLNIKASFFPEDSAPGRIAPVLDPGSGLVELAPPRAREEIAGAVGILRQLGYRDPLALQPRYRQIPEPLESDGASRAHWDLLAGEGKIDDPQEVADYIVDNAFPGAVVLMQPVQGQREQVLKMLPLISDKLRDRGYRFATLSELITTGETPSGTGALASH